MSTLLEDLSMEDLIAEVEKRTQAAVLIVPRDRGTVVYDEASEWGLTVQKDLPGFLVVSGSTVRVLRDDGSVEVMGGGMSEVERAVIVARLRTWADGIERVSQVELRRADGSVV